MKNKKNYIQISLILIFISAIMFLGHYLHFWTTREYNVLFFDEPMFYSSEHISCYYCI